MKIPTAVEVAMQRRKTTEEEANQELSYEDMKQELTSGGLVSLPKQPPLVNWCVCACV